MDTMIAIFQHIFPSSKKRINKQIFQGQWQFEIQVFSPVDKVEGKGLFQNACSGEVFSRVYSIPLMTCSFQFYVGRGFSANKDLSLTLSFIQHVLQVGSQLSANQEDMAVWQTLKLEMNSTVI